MRPDKGTVRADDGWRLEWDLSETPQRVDVFNQGPVQQYRVSGYIPHRHLDREIREFMREHAAQQMVMEW